jgi:pimeloyl-ACP methyl ester carboxylesterase
MPALGDSKGNTLNSVTQQFVDVEGARLEIFRGGEGHPIVCCQHPHSSNLERFQWYAEKTEFIYVVVRGLGNSSPIRETRDLTYLQAAHDLEAVRRTLGIERWVVQGFSAGSQVALLYALTYPDSLAGLISVAGFARSSDLLADPRSLCGPMYPEYQSKLDALRGQPFQRSPAVSFRPIMYRPFSRSPNRARGEQKNKKCEPFPLPEGGDQALHPQDIEHSPDIVG